MKHHADIINKDVTAKCPLLYRERKVAMDGVTNNVAQSVEAVNQILQTATQATIALDKKMLLATTEMAVGQELGKGQNVDATG